MELKVALDWTPNTQHAGIYMALLNHYFQDEDLKVELISPEIDGYTVSPAEKLVNKEVQIAIGASETVIQFNTQGEQSHPLKAVATMFQEDMSAIVTLKKSGIYRPAQLDEKVVGTYGRRFEEDTIQQLIMNDGGQGKQHFKVLEKLSIWEAFKRGKMDATWVFLPWEGLLAKHQEQEELHVFQLKDYGIPYGYSPVLISHQDIIDEEAEAIQAFLKAVEKGWQYVRKHPKDTAAKLKKHFQALEFQDTDFVLESLSMIIPVLFNSENRWGYMDSYHWLDFVDWMIEKQVLKDTNGVPMNHGQIDSSMLYTNEFYKM